jgi:hypothetical protein
MATPAPTSRTREAPQGDEEASSELKLGEFQDVDALTHSEAALVINALVSKRRGDRKNVNDTEYVSHLSFEEGREKRTASTAVAPGGPAERHWREGSLWGQAPKPPGSLRSSWRGEELAEDANGNGGDPVQDG